MNTAEKSILVCMSCMTPNDAGNNYCQNCRAPLAGPSSLDPMQSIRDEGTVLGKAGSGPPKLIVLLGTWILFLPWIIITAALEISIIKNWDGLPSFVFFLGGIALFLFAARMLLVVTGNFLKARDSFRAESRKKTVESENRQRAKARRQARMKNKNA